MRCPMYLRKRLCRRSGPRAGKDGNGPGPWPPRRWPSCSSWRQNSGPARFRPLPRRRRHKLSTCSFVRPVRRIPIRSRSVTSSCRRIIKGEVKRMLRRGFAALSFVSVLLLCSAGTLAQVDGGLLPFSARLPDAFYAHQLIDVAEDDGDGGGLRVQSEQRVYYKKPDSPDVSPYYYLGTDHPAWPLR